MSNNLGLEVIGAARHRIGDSFRGHFKPVNPCEFGKYTTDICMENGMDSQEGYDCVGLVIASLSDVLNVDKAKWNRDFRHVAQLERIAQPIEPQPGDAVVYYGQRTPREGKANPGLWKHLGLFVQDGLAIHASGVVREIVEGGVEGALSDVKVVPIQTLARLGLNYTP